MERAPKAPRSPKPSTAKSSNAELGVRELANHEPEPWSFASVGLRVFMVFVMAGLGGR